MVKPNPNPKQGAKPAPKQTPYYTPENFGPGNSVGYLVKHSGSLMAQIAETVFEGQTISFTQWIVLINLREHGAPMSPTELSEEVGHDMGALTRVVDALERSGYVKRERGLRDRRTVEISITPAGRRQTEDCRRLVMDLQNILVEPFSRSEIDTLIGLMQRMLMRLQDYLDQPPDPKLPAAVRDSARRKSQ
jgi:DNA-binding MarR family transcriptional regulator